MKRIQIIMWLFQLLIISSEAFAGAERCKDALSGLRGINASLNTGFSSNDIPKLSGWGVNLIRLVINADPGFPEYAYVYDDKGKISREFLRRVDGIVEAAGNHGIRIILDMHTFPGYKGGAIWRDKVYWESLVRLWQEISKHYKGNNIIVGYDLINEPNLDASLTISRPLHVKKIISEEWMFPEEWIGTSRDYFQLVSRLAHEINEIDPDKVVIVEGVGLGGRAANFIWMKPIEAANLAYSFHTYVPKDFGDSGKNGKSPDTTYVSIKQRQLLEADISHVENFAQLHKVRIFVGEFGLTYHAEGKGAGDWISDMVSLFERNGWSWAYWTYNIPFRNPEMVKLNDGTLEKRTDTERLTVLKEYWAKNHAQTCNSPK